VSYYTLVPEEVKRSSLRTEQAAQTRERILAADSEVFEEQGFAGATFDDIAHRAGVAVPTVYKAFTNKPNLLIGTIDQALSGSAGAIEQQAWFTEQLDEPDPVRQLHLIARNARRVSERAGPLLQVLRTAAPLDDALGRAWAEVAANRFARSRSTATRLIAKAPGRVRGSRSEVALTLSTLTEPEIFVTFTSAPRTGDQYEAWLADLLCRAILD
jgi:AcrR family transcriptional regulator